MKFTIGTVSGFQQFEKDLKLIKSSLLYADEIELIGLVEYATFTYLPTILDSEKDLDSFLSGLIPFLKSINIPNKDELLQQTEAIRTQLQVYSPFLKKKKRRTTAEIQAQMKMHHAQRELQAQITSTMQQLVNQPSSQELQTLIDRNIVSVYDYAMQGMNMDEMAGSYVGNMLNAIYAANTFPLLDDTSTGFIGQISKTKLLDISRLDAEVLRHAGVATHILMTLPTLEGASYDELLDFKRQNSAPLARFRKAIYGFSETISSLPWDNSFQYECVKLYEKEVVPQVAEINEIFTETSVLKNFGKKVLADEEIRKKAGFAAGGLATAITTSSSLSGVLSKLLLAMALSAFSAEAASGFLKVIDLGVQAHDEVKAKTKAGKENVMYYYYLATKL